MNDRVPGERFWKPAGYLVFGLIALLAVRSCLEDRWVPADIESSKQTGNEIIQALAKYNDKHSKYPPALSDLVPEELSAIRNPSAGEKKWHYRVGEDAHSFQLEFDDVTKYPAYYSWESTSRVWNYVPGDERF